MGRNRIGFTLMELLTVVLIISILTSMAIPAVSRAYLRARVTLKKVRVFHEFRLNMFMNDAAHESLLMNAATNTPKSFAPDNYIWDFKAGK